MLSLDAIVVPTRAAEIEQIRRNLVLWSSPHFSPSAGVSGDRPGLNFVFNNDEARPFEAELRETCARLGIDQHFREVSFTYLGLSGLDDIYSRKELGPVGPGGYKAGPNNQFFASMDLYRESSGAVFYMETDCIPIRAGWIEALQDVLRRHQTAYVIGSAYRGGGRLGKDIFRHVNGNAIYCVGQDGFRQFLEEWREWLLKLIAGGSRSLAYDVLVETVFTLAPKDKDANEFCRNYLARIQYSNFVQNVSAPQDAYLTDPEIVRAVRSRYADTFMMHGVLFARAVGALIESGKPLEPDNLLVAVEASARPLFGIERETHLGNAKRWFSERLRSFADWLDHNNVKHAFLRMLSGGR